MRERERCRTTADYTNTTRAAGGDAASDKGRHHISGSAVRPPELKPEVQNGAASKLTMNQLIRANLKQGAFY